MTSTDLLIPETLDAKVIFHDAARADDVITMVARAAKALTLEADPATATGRDTIRAVAYKVARSKSAIDTMRKEHTADLVKAKREVDAAGAKIIDALEQIQATTRRPLTDWEAREAERIAAHETAIADIERLGQFVQPEPPASVVIGRLGQVARFSGLDWEEFQPRAAEMILKVTNTLNGLHGAAVQREKDAAELESLRAEKAKRDAEDAARRVAEEKAQRDEAERVKREAEAVEAAAKATRIAEEKAQRAHDEAKAAAEASIQRERDRATAAEAARVAAEERAISDAKEAARKAHEAQDAAVAAERRRQEDEQRRKDEDAAAVKRLEEKRAANLAHRKTVNNRIVQALQKVGLLGEGTAKVIVEAIVKGEIPNVTIAY